MRLEHLLSGVEDLKRKGAEREQPILTAFLALKYILECLKVSGEQSLSSVG